MTMQWVLGWWNLIFLAPFAVALLYLGVYTMTGVGFGDADADGHGDFDADADADVHADVDGDAHVDADADADADHDLHGDAEGDADGHAGGAGGRGSVSMAALSWMGVGRVPLTLIVIVLLLTWGAAGFVTNALVRSREGWEAMRLSLPVALATGIVVTRGIVMFMGRFVPLNETYARRRSQLVGSVGEAVFGIDERFGMAAVRDDHGDLHQVACRVADGVGAVEKGARVKLVAYGGKERIFFVRRVERNE